MDMVIPMYPQTVHGGTYHAKFHRIKFKWYSPRKSEMFDFVATWLILCLFFLFCKHCSFYQTLPCLLTHSIQQSPGRLTFLSLFKKGKKKVFHKIKFCYQEIIENDILKITYMYINKIIWQNSTLKKLTL